MKTPLLKSEQKPEVRYLNFFLISIVAFLFFGLLCVIHHFTFKISEIPVGTQVPCSSVYSYHGLGDCEKSKCCPHDFYPSSLKTCTESDCKEEECCFSILHDLYSDERLGHTFFLAMNEMKKISNVREKSQWPKEFLDYSMNVPEHLKAWPFVKGGGVNGAILFSFGPNPDIRLASFKFKSGDAKWSMMEFMCATFLKELIHHDDFKEEFHGFEDLVTDISLSRTVIVDSMSVATTQAFILEGALKPGGDFADPSIIGKIDRFIRPDGSEPNIERLTRFAESAAVTAALCFAAQIRDLKPGNFFLDADRGVMRIDYQHSLGKDIGSVGADSGSVMSLRWPVFNALIEYEVFPVFMKKLFSIIKLFKDKKRTIESLMASLFCLDKNSKLCRTHKVEPMLKFCNDCPDEDKVPIVDQMISTLFLIPTGRDLGEYQRRLLYWQTELYALHSEHGAFNGPIQRIFESRDWFTSDQIQPYSFLAPQPDKLTGITHHKIKAFFFGEYSPPPDVDPFRTLCGISPIFGCRKTLMYDPSQMIYRDPECLALFPPDASWEGKDPQTFCDSDIRHCMQDSQNMARLTGVTNFPGDNFKAAWDWVGREAYVEECQLHWQVMAQLLQKRKDRDNPNFALQKIIWQKEGTCRKVDVKYGHGEERSFIGSSSPRVPSQIGRLTVIDYAQGSFELTLQQSWHHFQPYCRIQITRNAEEQYVQQGKGNPYLCSFTGLMPSAPNDVYRFQIINQEDVNACKLLRLDRPDAHRPPPIQLKKQPSFKLPAIELQTFRTNAEEFDDMPLQPESRESSSTLYEGLDFMGEPQRSSST